MKTIVITGCSTGFGRATALHLAERGWRVLATVRKEADRAGLLAQATAKGWQDRLIPVVCDITRSDHVEQLQRTLAELTAALDALLNNAGTSFPGPLEIIPLDDVRAQIEVNLIGQLAVTQALLPSLKAARGMILNVSSVGGRITFPANGAYHMSKYALEAMSDVLRVELAPSGVKVVVLEPGSGATAIWGTSGERARSSPMIARAGAYAPLIAALERESASVARGGFPPELFARTVDGILNSRRPATRYPIPRSAAGMMLVRRLLPDRAWDWLQRRVLKW
jgi:NAD(P)-dependent dehydrogenase (short-subunit alcohol dehydrogenase family)